MIGPLSLLTLLAPLAHAAPFIESADLEYQVGFGAGSDGLWARGDHTWLEHDRFDLRTGLALGAFAGSEAWEQGGIRTTGTVFDVHLQLHADLQFTPGPRDRVYAGVGLYGGGYWYRSTGEWVDPDLGLTQPFRTTAVLPDWGLRLSLGFQPWDRVGIQLSVGDSLRRLTGEQGLLGGVLTADGDAKFTIGLGVRYRFGGRAPEGDSA